MGKENTIKTDHMDPVVTEIIRNGFIATTEEMKTNLTRSAYNMIIYEALDFTVGLFDANGDTISIGIGLPMFIRGMSDTVKAKIKHFGLDGIHPGDILLTNDAYLTGSHLNHLTFTSPVFFEGEIIGFAVCMAHWQDIGGTLDGMTTDIYSEGLQIPIVKIWREGTANQDILDIIRMNVRLPERAMGDLNAQVAAIQTGERRLGEMLAKYGRDTVLGAVDMIYKQSEAAARKAVESMPNGTYEAESFMDDDGVDVDQRVRIKVKVIIEGDRMIVDFSDLSDQVKGFYNSGETAGLSCAGVAFKCLTSAGDWPINAGSFRPLEVILPSGKIVSAEKPAPMRWWMTYPMTIVDTIFKALAPAMPGRVVAGHHADLCVASINGRNPDGSLFLYLGGLTGGGWGAKHNEDGVSATIAINDGDTHNGPSEQVESKYPLLVERYALREDSGGAGKFRGGFGAEQVVRALGDVMFNAQIERVKCVPWGLEGGLSAKGNQVLIQKGDGERVAHDSGKVLSCILRKGDAYAINSGGGGGFGSPLDRDPALVERDVRQGYVSRSAAHDLYGVLFDPETMEPDVERTNRLRLAMLAAGLPKDINASAASSGNAQPLAEQLDEGSAEVAEWERAIREAGLLRSRCGCC